VQTSQLSGLAERPVGVGEVVIVNEAVLEVEFSDNVLVAALANLTTAKKSVNWNTSMISQHQQQKE